MMVTGATFNFSSIVRHYAVRQGDREVLVDRGGARRITWSTLDKRVDACAAVLRDAGKTFALIPGKEPVFRGWEFHAPTSLNVTLAPA